jgi:hypothetical protein
MFVSVKKGVRVVVGIAAVLLGMGCGELPNMSQNNAQIIATRRIFVNDAAANDSLVSGFSRQLADSGGLLFVMQPGASYQLRIAPCKDSSVTTGGPCGPVPSTLDGISLYTFTSFGFSAPQTLAPVLSNDTEVFNVQSDYNQATYFASALNAPDGVMASQRIGHVSLVSLNTTPTTDTLRVNLMIVGNFSSAGLQSASQDTVFADSFLSELASVYQGAQAGFNPPLTFVGTFSIVSGPQEILDFGPTFVPLPGTRVGNAANLYLIDSITFNGLLPGEEVLGFSPREVVDMSTDEDSRVILSAGAAVAASISSGGPANIVGGIPSLATTTAHELGHFFGLRHPTATNVDLTNDDDLSNRDDGLGDTPLCGGLTKKAAGGTVMAVPSPEHIVNAPYNHRPYCLYIAQLNFCQTDPCDITNLMFAYSYSCVNPKTQRQVTSEQQNFFRKNLALLQGK